MAVPQPKQQQTPTRALSEYTVGNPDTRVDLATSASSPNIGSLAANPSAFVAIGVTSAAVTVTLPALAAGAVSAQVVTIPLPAMPPGVLFGPNDNPYFTAAVSVTNPTALPITQFAFTPIAISSGGTPYIGPNITNNVLYTSYEVKVQVSFVAIATYAGGGVVTIRADGILWDQPG